MATADKNRGLRFIPWAAAVLACGFILCVLIAVPRPDSISARLTSGIILTNAVPVIFLFLACYLIFRRILTTSLLIVFICLLITIGNSFKFSVVSQPVIASDFILAGQVLANPKLFGKYFLEQWYLFPLLAIVLVLPIWTLYIEPPLLKHKAWAISLALLGIALLWQAENLLLKPEAPLQKIYKSRLPEFDHRQAMQQVEQYGLFATLINAARKSYFQLPEVTSQQQALITELESLTKQSAVQQDQNLPNIVIILNEAFFDFRVIDPAFPKNAYRIWDQLKQSSQHGLVTVDTYGGATLRTEFTVLTGIPLSWFGPEMDYPYLTVVKNPMHALPQHLKQLSYHTTAIHPYIKTFWRRHLAYPRLGFDTFLSRKNFGKYSVDGPYISDQVVCKTILKQIKKSDQPDFIFAVTMENHGPWSFDRKQRGSLNEFKLDNYEFDGDVALQLKRYLYHAQNAAKMAHCLTEGLTQLSRPSTLLFFGDHAPAMPSVYKAFAVDNPWHEPKLLQVPYLLWRSDSSASKNQDTNISHLPDMLLQKSRLPQDRFFRLSNYLRQHCLSNQAASNRCPKKPTVTMRALINERLQPKKIKTEQMHSN